MARNKDPAVMFYTADFLVGVQNLTMEERGQYITLLCLQHQQGHLSEKIIKLSVGTISQDVLAKFDVDSEGLYYQHRMDEETAKRDKYVTSRQENGKKGGRPAPEKPYGYPYGKPTGNLLDNDNENINVIKDIIEYLNNKLSTKYQYTSNYIMELVGARLEEGYVLQDFKVVIDKKYSEWYGTEFAKFLRPETLFGNKFSRYLNQVEPPGNVPRYSTYDPAEVLESAVERANKKDLG